MTSHRPGRRAVAAAAVALLGGVGLFAACAGDDPAGDSATTTEAPAASIEVTGAWARTSPAVTDAGALYMEIANGGDADDALVGVTVDAAVAGTAEIHETVTVEGDTPTTGMPGQMPGSTEGQGGMDGTMGGGGMMEMRPVGRVEIPAGETVSFEPGGYHVMLLGLAQPLATGTTVEVTLTFEDRGEQVVTADVRDTAP
jgi:copper(I)-binding protein